MADIKTVTELAEIVDKHLGECADSFRGGNLTTSDIEILDKLSHTAKCLATIIAMEEAKEEGGYSERSYEGGSRRSYEGSRRSYEGGNSGRRGRSPRTGRYVSRDSGYSSHDGLEDIMDDIRDLSESEKRKLKQMLD